MIDVIIPITDKKEKFDLLLNKLASLEEVRVFIGITKNIYDELAPKYLDIENFGVVEFEESVSKEGMINYFQKYLGKNELIILRRPISFEEFSTFANSTRDIATCKRNFSKFKAFMFAVWQRILRLFLGITMYDGDTSVIFIGRDFASVAAQSSSLSFSTRVNRWRGVEQDLFHISGEPAKYKLDKMLLIKYLLVIACALTVGVVVTTCVCLFANMSILIGLLLVCLDIVCLVIALLTVVILLFNKLVGKKDVEEAIIIKDNMEEDL